MKKQITKEKKFTLNQIIDIHERFGKLSTLLQYLQALKAIGVNWYDSFAADGHSEYFGNDNQKVVSLPVHLTLTIAKTSSQDDLQKHLSLHNQGKINYLEMSKRLAESGIEKWTFDTSKMTITYYDGDGHKLLVETII